MQTGDKVELRDGTIVEVLSVPSDAFFIARQADGKTGIFYTSQIKK